MEIIKAEVENIKKIKIIVVLIVVISSNWKSFRIASSRSSTKHSIPNLSKNVNDDPVMVAGIQRQETL